MANTLRCASGDQFEKQPKSTLSFQFLSLVLLCESHNHGERAISNKYVEQKGPVAGETKILTQRDLLNTAFGAL
jgi:hypothetical protein